MADISNLDDMVNSTIRTIVLKPGEKFILPQDAIIDSVLINGSIDVNSTCDNLPTPSAYKCGYFYITIDNDDNNGHSMDERHTYIVSIRVGNNIYGINRRIITSGDSPGILQTPAVLNTHVPDQVLLTFTKIRRNTLSKRQQVFIYIKTPEDLFNTIEMEIDNYEGSLSTYRPLSTECDIYEFGDEDSADPILPI